MSTNDNGQVSAQIDTKRVLAEVPPTEAELRDLFEDMYVDEVDGKDVLQYSIATEKKAIELIKRSRRHFG